MGALRTSEDSEVVGGEAKAAKSDADRSVDAPGRIIIDSAPIAAVTQTAPAAAPPRPRAPAVTPQRSGGLGLVIFVYILAAAALGAAIYERFFMART